MSEFWIQFLEYLYLPIQSFLGDFDPLIGFLVLFAFFALQIWLVYHLFLKPIKMVFKFLFDIVKKNILWSDYDED